MTNQLRELLRAAARAVALFPCDEEKDWFMGDGIIYRNYGDADACGTLDEFVLERVRMDAALVGGMRDAALEYTWAVSDNNGESYRNPTDQEREEFYEAVWAYRARNIDCSRDCHLRGRFDGIWRCMTCLAVWTEADGGRTYGVPMSGSQLRLAIRELAQSDLVRSAWRGRVLSGAMSVVGDYELALAAGKQDTLIMDVKLSDSAWFRFLSIQADEYGGWYVRWVGKL